MFSVTVSIDKADELIAAMIRLAEALEKKKSEEQSSPQEKKVAHIHSIPDVTLVQVRAALTAKKDKKEAIAELLKKYGATKLSEMDPAHYADLLQDVEKL